MRILITIAAMTASAGVALAQPAAPAEPVAAPAARSSVPDDDVGAAPEARRFDPMRVLCRRVAPRTGTRVIRDRGDQRLCQTMAEWDRQSELGQEALRERDRGVCGSPDCGMGR
jgi:hypothetical protein